MDYRVRPALLAVAFAAIAGCEGLPDAEAAGDPFVRLAADSAVADAENLASLPPSLAEWLDISEYLDSSAWDSLPIAACHLLDPREPGTDRRRLTLRLPDSATVLLYAVARHDNGVLERVEFIRRTPGVGQRGIVWDVERDRTLSTWWREGRSGLSRRAERGELPRGGPVPRAMRALGRQLFLVSPCEDEPPREEVTRRRTRR